jgi:ABC-type branched-subunit amino acid transport system ATPase component
MTAMLNVQDATVRFGGVVAVREVTLSIESGCICGIIGPNGSGKTTLIGALSRLVSLTSGQLFFEGAEYTKVPSHVPSKMGITRTFQAVRLLGHMTVRQNVMLGAGSAVVRRSVVGNWLNLPRSLADERQAGELADESLARVGMEDYQNSYPSDLSYGMQRRVEIARALATRPKLLLLDEPIAGMSQAERRDIGQLLLDLQRQGLTQVLVEHDLAMIHRVCDTSYALNFGQVIGYGPPREVAAAPAVREAYLGHKAAVATAEPGSYDA